MDINKKFGLLMAFFFGSLGAANFFFHNNFYGILFSSLSIFFISLFVKNSTVLSKLRRYWIQIGSLLSIVSTPLILAFFFFLILSPLALIIKFFGYDQLKIKKRKINSFWIDKSSSICNLDKQF